MADCLERWTAFLVSCSCRSFGGGRSWGDWSACKRDLIIVTMIMMMILLLHLLFTTTGNNNDDDNDDDC